MSKKLVNLSDMSNVNCYDPPKLYQMVVFQREAFKAFTTLIVSFFGVPVETYLSFSRVS